jgi:hypothetical protein
MLLTQRFCLLVARSSNELETAALYYHQGTVCTSDFYIVIIIIHNYIV